MAEKTDPQLIASGPYGLIRHPIYSGILLAALGTGLAVTFYWFIPFILFGIYFIYSAFIEEKTMAKAFPKTYPGYKAKTKMLIPFVF